MGIQSFEFGETLKQLRAGKKVERLGWNGRGMYIALQEPDQHSR